MPILADGVTLASAILLIPQLVSRLQEPHGLNAFLISGVFFVFVLGVFFIRRMKAAPPGTTDWLTRGWRTVVALFFAFVLSLALAWQLGFFESAAQADVTQMGEGGAASYFVFGPGAWLAFSLIYVLVFAFTVEPRIDPTDSGYVIAAVAGLTAAATMTLILAAQAQSIALALGTGWGWAVLSFVLLVLLFLPPRLLYLARVRGLRSPAAYAGIASLVILLAVLAARPQ